MSNTNNFVIAVLLSKTKLQFAAATFQSTLGWQPQWQTCVDVMLRKSSDVVQTIEQLCNGVDPSVVLVCQKELYSLLSDRYADRTIQLVADHINNANKSRAFWWPLVPTDWESVLRSHWRIADMVYSHTWRAHQKDRLAQRKPQQTTSNSGLFERYKHRPDSARDSCT